jgi:hypothetical protein
MILSILLTLAFVATLLFMLVRAFTGRYDLKLWIGSGDVSAAYLPG